MLLLFSWRFKKLILRKSSSDVKVFVTTFIQKEFDIQADNVQIIVDAGAYTGLSTLWFSKKYPNAKIIAIEPANDNFEILRKHTAHLSNVIAVNAALWSTEKELSVQNPGEGHWSYSVVTQSGDELNKTRSITLNQLIAEHNIQTIDILKLDIEGAEKEIFDSSTDWVSSANNVIVELHEHLARGCTRSMQILFPEEKWETHEKGEKVVLSKKTST